MAKTRKTRSAGAGTMKLSLKLDPDKVKKIQSCLKKGQLTITVASATSIARGGNGYQYD